METVQHARQLIMENVHRLPVEKVDLQDAHRRVIAADIVAPFDHPLFDQSAMDGYGFCYDDYLEKKRLPVLGEIKAGDKAHSLLANHAVRIFTGAPMPAGADTVVKQEDVARSEGHILIRDQALQRGANVRYRGEQFKAGTIALKSGQQLTPAAIGVLSSFGMQQVPVAKLPEVGIIVTGSELIPPGEPIGEGKKYESNGHLLCAALKGMQIDAVCRQADDTLTHVRESIVNMAKGKDVLILTGGVSVGAYDFVNEALESEGYRVVFHRISQKPGSPLLFARKGEQVVFALPGNPRAVLICFYLYVLPYLRLAMGSHKPWLPICKMPLASDYVKRKERTCFLTAGMADEGIVIGGAQQSHLLKSFVCAEVIVELPKGPKNYRKGNLVTIHLLPVGA